MKQFKNLKEKNAFLTDVAIKILDREFREIEKLDDVVYRGGMPDFLAELLESKKLYYETEGRIEEISKYTKIDKPSLRKMLKNSTLSELEGLMYRDGKLIKTKNFTLY